METIKRVEDSKYDVYNLYKLQQLNEGLWEIFSHDY
jgi:hypothetical protein